MVVNSDLLVGGRRLPVPNIEAGEWLRNLRRYWQITQFELAEQSGAPDAAMVGWIEAGEVRLPSYMYDAYARAFSIEPAEFAEYCGLYYEGKRPAAFSRPAA